MEIVEFDFLNDNFIEHVNDFSKSEPFQLFYLYIAINMVNNEGENFYDAFVLTNNTCKIIGLCIDSGYYFYGKNWTETEIKIIRKRVNFVTFTNGFHFVGTTGLVNDIFNDNKTQTVDFKDRYFYKINSNPTIDESPYVIIEPNKSDIQKLAELIQESHKEEYKELSVRTLVESIEQAQELVSKSNIFINKKNNEITGFCSVMYTESDSPLIGTLYIKEEYRNKGIGKALLSFAAEKLMKEKANACYLVTERNNISANKVIQSVGFKKIYENIDKTALK